VEQEEAVVGQLYSEDEAAAQPVLSCIVSSHYLAMTSEQTEDFTYAVIIVIWSVSISDGVIVICSYEI
jgi:hypothetical protein